MELSILCVVCINIECVWNYAEIDNNVLFFYPVFHSNSESNNNSN